MINNSLKKFGKVNILILFASILILIPPFLLLIAASWNSDDYFIAKLYQTQGLYGLSERILTWSPRFFSEIILYLYYNTVPRLGKSFTGGMILVIWLLLIGSVFIFIRDILKKNSLLLQHKKENLANTKIKNKAENIYLQLFSPLLITLIFFIYLLFSTRPGQMFYVVAVSASYVSALAGIILNLNFFMKQSDSQSIARHNIFNLIIFGIITSSSWEIGAIYQVIFSSLLFLLLLLNIFFSNLYYLPFSCMNNFDKWKLSIANLIPFSLSLYILFILKSVRVGSAEVDNLNYPLTGDLRNSLIASVLRFFKELFFLNNPAGSIHTDFFSFSYSITYKLGFLLLLTILFYQLKIKCNKITINACFLSIIPLVITNFIITFSAYYQFAGIHAGRQVSFKSGLIGLIIVLISLMIASLVYSKQKEQINIYSVLNSPITLIINFSLTLTLLINLQLNHLKQDLSNFQNLIISNNLNWQENLNSNESFAIHTQVPSSYIFRQYMKPGIYPSCDKSNNQVAVRYMNYFDKQKLYAIPFKRQDMDDENNIISQKIKSLENKIYFACSLSFGNIEGINKFTNLNRFTNPDRVIEVKIDENVEIVGWAINPDKTKAKMIIITVEDDENLLVNTPVNIPRPDVAEYFKNPNLVNSGWKAILTPSSEWDGQIITFKVWTYNPDTKIANFSQDFVLKFTDNSQSK